VVAGIGTSLPRQVTTVTVRQLHMIASCTPHPLQQQNFNAS
jgi:hypothetical protein